jgi:dTDP-4-dehydrorhamnose reductase
MRTLILGASGLVGGNCLNHFNHLGWSTIGTHFSYETSSTQFFNTLDLEDKTNANLDEFNPDVIVHCGALTWVDYCEDHQEESYQKTVQSTINAVAIAQKYKAKLVYLSTDYVFDGKRGFYIESDPVNALSIYGKHKLEAEQYIQSKLKDYLICRITNVYGDEIRGKNFIARLVENMLKRERMELNLPIDQYATPVNAADVARAIGALLTAGKTGVFHFAGTDYLNRVQLAERVAQYFGHDLVQINYIGTAEMNQPAARPLNGGFNASKFNNMFPHFKWTNVDDYLTLKRKV